MSTIDLNDFTKNAIRTESTVDTVVVDHDLLEGVIALSICSGEMMDMLKKNIFYKKPFSMEDFNDCARFADSAVGLIHNTTMLPSLNPQPITVNARLLHSLMGIYTESAELLEAMDAYLHEGAEIDVVNIREEFGDVEWYVALGVDTLDIEFKSVFDLVIAKLKARFPDNFTTENAIVRDLHTEREILEDKETS